MAEQYGRGKCKVLKLYGATDTTPKTDILIGNKRLSLKIGLAQLMSGGKEKAQQHFISKTLIKSTFICKKSHTI